MVPVRTALLGLILAGSALAEPAPFDGGARLYLGEGILRGSPRLFGLAGAYVGIAEGAEAMIRNPAGVAQKDPRFRSGLNLDLGFSLHLLPPGAVAWQDWDNDGRVDQLGAQRSLREYLGAQTVYAMVQLQLGRFGIGLGADLFNYASNTSVRAHDLAVGHVFANVGWAFGEDDLLVGLGLDAAGALVTVLEDRRPTDVLGYRGFAPQAGVLFRPHGDDYRLGASFRPQLTAQAPHPRESIGGLRTFPGVVSPARLLVGGSFALGEGRAYNITSRDEWAEVEPYLDGRKVRSAALMKWVLSAQVDLVFPVRNATSTAAFLEQDLGLPARSEGASIAVTPRFGLEKELLPDQIRLRTGTFLEPALISTGEDRWHVTFGGEVFLFRLFAERIGFGAGFDLAKNYLNLSFGFLPWK